MEYTQNHGLTISKFTLGTVQLGMEYGLANRTGQPSLEQAHRILDAARASGVNSLDTAGAYGNSEQVIGTYLGEKGSNSFPIVTSKFVLEGEDVPVELEDQLSRTLSRLNITRLPVYMLHRAAQMTQFGGAVPDTLSAMIASDRVGLAGVSIYTRQDVDEFLRQPLYRAIQIPLSALDTRLIESGHLEALQARGVVLFVRSVFLQGLLCLERVPEGYEMAQPSIDALREVACSEGISLEQLAVSFVRDLPGVSSLVLGCETAEQVLANARLIGGPALTQTACDEVLAIGRKTPIEAIMNRITAKK